MKNSIENNNLIFIPNAKIDEYEFDGIPCPTKEVHNLVGDKGVQDIHNQMQEMREWRKKMFGEKRISDYGFCAMELFADVRSNIVLAVGTTIGNQITQLNDELGDKRALNYYPKLVVSDVYKKNNYEKLISENHYLIEIYEQHIPRIETSDLIGYYRNKYRL
ncbi:hypothetical protein ACQY1Q_13600 [Tenacibaculum sp. TC6]|uniref:hypothetical protein n=1 Tax=Tenacibaculum sp. TC6 TaxID=3423223 RepID=UPI003D368F6B